MSARSRADLERDLRALGIRCSVEEWDALAVLVPAPGDRALEDEELRRRAIALARSHGFSHLAMDLSEERDVASRETVPRH
jgi:hypothetical protein